MHKYGYEDKRTVKNYIFETNPNVMENNDIFSETEPSKYHKSNY